MSVLKLFYILLLLFSFELSFGQDDYQESQDKIIFTEELVSDLQEEEAQRAYESRKVYEQSAQFKALQSRGDAFSDGFDKMKSGDYKGSIENFTEYLDSVLPDENPADNANIAHAYLNRGVAYFRLDNFRAAISDFERSRRLAASIEQKLLQVGINEPYFKNFITDLDHWIEASRDRSNPVKKETKTEDAEDEKSAAARKTASDFNQSGLRKCSLKQYKEALDDFDQSYQAFPDPRVLCNRGLMQFLLKNKAEGKNNLNTAISTSKNENDMYMYVPIMVFQFHIADTSVLRLGVKCLRKCEPYVTKFNNYALRSWHEIMLENLSKGVEYMKLARKESNISSSILNEASKGIERLQIKNAVLVQFSADEKKLLATYRSTGELILWDIVTGSKLIRYKGNSGKIYNASMTSDGKYVMAFCSDSTTSLWDASNGRMLGNNKGKSGKTGNILSPNGKTMLSVDMQQSYKETFFCETFVAQVSSEDINLWQTVTSKTLVLKKNNKTK